MKSQTPPSQILRYFDAVHAEPVEWLWYPYIPLGKITLLQGDPGDGKSFLMMNIISMVTRGLSIPDGRACRQPATVIYQCSEDGIADTIKPRLQAVAADCSRVAFIDEEINDLTLESDLLKNAIQESGAKLVVIDPIQAYLGADANLNSIGKTRRLMHKLGLWAAIYGCAIVLVGHMNKKESSKELYRSVGSIDVVAAARSVLQVNRVEESSTVRTIHHIKSSLAPLGPEVLFELSPSTGFHWCTTDSVREPEPIIAPETRSEDTKQQIAVNILRMWLKTGDMSTAELKEKLGAINISYRTACSVKKNMNIISYKKGNVWYWGIRSSD